MSCDSVNVRVHAGYNIVTTLTIPTALERSLDLSETSFHRYSRIENVGSDQYIIDTGICTVL